jgi:hypothetical protein
MSAHQTEFQARLARINAGQGFTKSTVYVGMETTFSYTPPNRKKAGISLAMPSANIGAMFGFPFAMLAGFVAHGVERYADFALFGLTDPTTLSWFAVARMAGVALVLSMLVMYLLRLRDRELVIAQALGVVAGVVAFHNLAHGLPELCGQVFSPEWVEMMTSATRPGSLYFMGSSFQF